MVQLNLLYATIETRSRIPKDLIILGDHRLAWDSGFWLTLAQNLHGWIQSFGNTSISEPSQLVEQASPLVKHIGINFHYLISLSCRQLAGLMTEYWFLQPEPVVELLASYLKLSFILMISVQILTDFIVPEVPYVLPWCICFGFSFLIGACFGCNS